MPRLRPTRCLFKASAATFIVGSTWQANTGLMTSSGAMRPAMTWLLDFLGR